MDVEFTPLPGIGECHTFTTVTGHRVGVVTHYAGGRRELIHGVGDPAPSPGGRVTGPGAATISGRAGLVAGAATAVAFGQPWCFCWQGTQNRACGSTSSRSAGMGPSHFSQRP
jgi:hypothetical protein